MTSIILWGRANTGKTHTLKTLVKLLCDEHKAKIIFDDSKDDKDFCLILEIKGKRLLSLQMVIIKKSLKEILMH